MNYIVSNQMKQHREFLEKQELKEKELASTVELPKLDMIPFYGDKLNGQKLGMPLRMLYTTIRIYLISKSSIT